MGKMKAVLWTGYGLPDVLKTGETNRPEPGNDEILVKVACSSVTKGDCETRALDLPFSIRTAMRFMFGIRRPGQSRILGQEFSGTVVSKGNGVYDFKEGEKVFGSPGIRMGAYAEYICVPENKGMAVIAKVPEGLDLKTASVMTTGGMEALHFFQKSGMKKGDTVLINGAGGSIGTLFLQFAKRRGAHITAVDSEDKLGLLHELGADRTIDYRKVDFSLGEDKYDYVFDVVGRKCFRKSLRALERKGTYLLANPTFPKLLASVFVNIFTSKKIISGASDYSRENLEHLAEEAANGDLRIIVDREFSMDEIREAHEYVDRGRKKGNVVIVIDRDQLNG